MRIGERINRGGENGVPGKRLAMSFAKFQTHGGDARKGGLKRSRAEPQP